MKAGSVVLARIQQADGRLKLRPVVFLSKMLKPIISGFVRISLVDELLFETTTLCNTQLFK